MATGPDLSSARAAVEALMDDTCLITRDVEQFSDDVLDPVTGVLVPPAPDTINIYSGRCKVSPEGVQPSERREGGVDVYARTYRGAIPWGSPMPQVGDLMSITSSYRDPELVGKVFRVKSVAVSTFLVSRRLELELR